MREGKERKVHRLRDLTGGGIESRWTDGELWWKDHFLTVPINGFTGQCTSGKDRKVHGESPKKDEIFEASWNRWN